MSEHLRILKVGRAYRGQGHPAVRLLHSMKRDGLRRGITALCIGSRQRIALALEILD